MPEKFKDQGIDRKGVHKWLSRKIRHYKGRKPIQRRFTHFVLDADMYDLKEDEKGRLWIGIMSLTPRERIKLRLSSERKFSGNIRVVLRGAAVEIHYTEEEEVPEAKPESEVQKVIGIDKGFKEVLTDSEGKVYGGELGEKLRVESDRLSEKNKRRNQIRAVAEKAKKNGNNPKAKRIRRNNLGRKKYTRRKWRERKKIKTYIGRSLHELFLEKKPEVVVGEDLNFVYGGKRNLPKKVKRYFSGWLKGVLGQVIEMRCLRSGATYVPVNAAYTSQVCSFCGCFGKRKGDTFHCLKEGCGKEVDADYNGARNVLKRYRD